MVVKSKTGGTYGSNQYGPRGTSRAQQRTGLIGVIPMGSDLMQQMEAVALDQTAPQSGHHRPLIEQPDGLGGEMDQLVKSLGLIEGPLPSDGLALMDQMYGHLPQRSATYLSTPVTGGPIAKQIRASESKPKGRTEFTAQLDRIIAANAQRSNHVAEQWQAAHPDGALINPADVHEQDGWTENDYSKWWMGVMNRYVKDAVFNEGWETSTGCVIEMATLQEWGVPCSTTEGEPLSPQKTVQMLDRALATNPPRGATGRVRLACRERIAALQD